MQPNDTLSKTSWFKGIKNSNDEVLETIFSVFQPPILSMLKSKGATNTEAEDIFMNILEAIFQKSQSRMNPFFDEEKFEGYFTKACLFHWYKICRKKKFNSGIKIEELAIPSDLDLEQELTSTERRSFFWKKFRELGQDCQKVLQLFIIEEKSHQEVANELGLTYQYAKKKKYRCNKRLIDSIKADPLYKELAI